ncbi:Malic enzyme [Perkinsus olseni]|uniref:Malic enzyme n=1 Tax=Perkinsus olseni TaxID=32597 RepID=A0A7J6PJI3_PEROL|nr:Malic enzyme [Perkinsus olseni]
MAGINIVQPASANGSKANFDVRMLPMEDIVAAAPTEALIEWYHLVLSELYHRQSASPHLYRWSPRSSTIVNIDENRVKLQIWDTVWGKFTASYCRGSAVVFFVYDVAKRKTYEELTEFVKKNVGKLNKNVTKVLIGNKADLLGREHG